MRCLSPRSQSQSALICMIKVFCFCVLNHVSELGALRGRTIRQHAAAEGHEDQTEPVDARERRRAGGRREVQQGARAQTHKHSRYMTVQIYHTKHSVEPLWRQPQSHWLS